MVVRTMPLRTVPHRGATSQNRPVQRPVPPDFLNGHATPIYMDFNYPYRQFPTAFACGRGTPFLACWQYSDSKGLTLLLLGLSG